MRVTVDLTRMLQRRIPGNRLKSSSTPVGLETHVYIRSLADPSVYRPLATLGIQNDRLLLHIHSKYFGLAVKVASVDVDPYEIRR